MTTPPPDYPDVVVDEVTVGAREITGVPTSITAFIGAAARGPVDVPVAVTSAAEFERAFGSASTACPMGDAVRAFFVNGGSDARIVRVTNGATTATCIAGALRLQAASPGAWGSRLRVRVDHPAPTAGGDTSLFTLSVRDTAIGATEVFRDVSSRRTHARFVGTVLAQESRLVRLRGAGPGRRPAATPLGAAGVDPLTVTPGSIAFAADGADGAAITAAQVAAPALRPLQRGLWALDREPFVNLLCIPPFARDAAGDIGAVVRAAAADYCRARGALFVVDPPPAWDSVAAVIAGMSDASWGLSPHANAALYVPRLVAPDPLQPGQSMTLAPCGAVAGVMARTDRETGVWKAPAGRTVTLRGIDGVTVRFTDRDSEQLNPRGVNGLRSFADSGLVVWGARTLAGSGGTAPEVKYVAVRRLSFFIERSVADGTQWAVFEPNDETLWSRLRVAVDAFLMGLFRGGAFAGRSTREAYFVHCGADTMTQHDVDAGIVRIEIGFAPLEPAEFVVVRISHRTGQGAMVAAPGPSRAGTRRARIDPYASFRFRVHWQGRVVAGVTTVSGLVAATTPDARDVRVGAPATSRGDSITMERGVTHDAAFTRWIAAHGDAGAPRADVVLELLDERGRPAATYTLQRCVVTGYQAMPELDANANAVAIAHLSLRPEGIGRA